MLQNIYNDILSPDVNLVNAVVKLLLSMLLGATIGMERRRKGQIAGLRTFALISMGATLAMLISIYIPQVYLGLKNGDPGLYRPGRRSGHVPHFHHHHPAHHLHPGEHRAHRVEA